MPNPIKYSTGAESLALKKGNFYIGTGDVGKGPSETTGYYQGPDVPTDGYVIYLNNAGQPGNLSYHIANNDSELISFTNELAGASYTTVNECLVYYAGQSDKVCVNRDYEGIVTDGLILNLDAGFIPSYPTSGSTWYNVSNTGSSNGTLTNGPTYSTDGSGSIVFDGVNDYAPVGGSTPSSLQGNPSFTVEGWFKRSGDWYGGATWGIAGDSSFQGINSYIYGQSNARNRISIDLWGRTTLSAPETYSDTEWKHCVWTYNGTTFTTSNIIIYVNTVSYTGGQLTVHRGNTGDVPNLNSNGIVLSRAGRTTNDYYGKPIIGNFKIYDRVLSPFEITQNFNALRGRYGI